MEWKWKEGGRRIVGTSLFSLAQLIDQNMGLGFY
jgi:hypothetical protein